MRNLRCDLTGLSIVYRLTLRPVALFLGGLLLWLLALPIIDAVGLALYALATGAWPREATMLYLAFGHLVGLI